MRRLTLLSVALLACAALAQGKPADMVYTSGRLQIRLSQADCSDPALVAMLAAGGALTVPKAATVTRGATEIQGCWALDADLDVLIGDEAGSQGYVPMSEFRPAATRQRDWV